MAFTPSTLSVILQTIGGVGMRFVSYRSDDAIATVAGTDYFTGGESYGLRLHDLIFVSPVSGTVEPYILVVTEVDSEGNVTATQTAFDADLTALAGLDKSDGNFIVGDGSTWVVENGATARTSLGLGSAAVANLLDEDDMASDSATAVPSQQSVKAFAGNPANHVFTQQGTGAVARSVDDKLKERPTVTDYDVVGDGSADDAAQLAVAFATGLVMEVPPGTYNAESAVAITGFGQRIFGTAPVWSGNTGDTSRIHFTYENGSGLDITHASVALANLHLSGVSRAAGVGKMVDADRGSGIQPDIDVALDHSYLTDAKTGVYVNGRGAFLENCLIGTLDVALDIDFPTDHGTATAWGGTLSSGARKYVARNNYIHQSSGSFIRNTGANASVVHGIHAVNNYVDNASNGLTFFNGKLNNGLLALNQIYRITAASAFTITGCVGVGLVTGNLVYGSITDVAEEGFSPIIARQLATISGDCDTVIIENNAIAFNNRPLISVSAGANIDVLIIRGLYAHKVLLGNGSDGRTDSLIEIALTATIGRLVIDDVHVTMDAMAGNASAYIVKNQGTIGEMVWGDVTVNSDAGLAAKAFGCAGKGMSVLLAKSAAQTLTTGTNTTVSWATETRDDAGFFNVGAHANNVVIPQGVKRIKASCAIEFASNATGDRRVRILKNNNIIAGMGVARVQAANGSATNIYASTAEIAVSAGDTIQVSAAQASGGDLDISANDQTWFQVVVV